MIAFIRGEIVQIEEDGLVIENNGVGLFVLAPLSMMQPLPPLGGSVFLHTHLQIREDAWQLFGFPEKEQLTVFRYLLAVSGVGAKTALARLAFAKLPMRWPRIIRTPFAAHRALARKQPSVWF